MKQFMDWFIGPPWPQIKESFPWRKFMVLAIGTYVALALALMGMLVAMFGIAEINDPEAWADVLTWPVLAAAGWYVAIGLVFGTKWLIWRVQR